MSANAKAIDAPSVQARVRQVVALLMKRPITEAIAMEVGEIPGFEDLEIVDGQWVGFDNGELDMGGEEHGWIKAILITLLTTWALEKRAGRVYPGDTDFVLDGDDEELRVVRRPDVSFVADARVSQTKGYIYGAPDLVIEIISPSERPGKISEKLGEYLQFGVKQVWQVYPEKREIIVNLPDGTTITYSDGDTLPGGDLLPGFGMDVATVFES